MVVIEPSQHKLFYLLKGFSAKYIHTEHLARVGGRRLGEGQGRWERKTGRGRRGDMEVREGRWGRGGKMGRREKREYWETSWKGAGVGGCGGVGASLD